MVLDHINSTIGHQVLKYKPQIERPPEVFKWNFKKSGIHLRLLTVGLLYGRKTGTSLAVVLFSHTANKDNRRISSGCRVHQLSVATATFPDINKQLNIESTHSVKDSKTI